MNKFQVFYKRKPVKKHKAKRKRKSKPERKPKPESVSHKQIMIKSTIEIAI
jgi:hypothetical protein